MKRKLDIPMVRQLKLRPGSANPANGSPLSEHYFDLLAVRKKLPVYEFLEELESNLSKHQVLVVEGETGSGKTTQIPQAIALRNLEEQPRGRGLRIVCCTQPRRVAAISVARRVAEEMDVEFGREVGYTVRFDDRTCPQTILKYMTDGMLLRECMSDPSLSRYSTVILDEAHERTLSTDILLGSLKKIMRERPDLKVIVMSATLNAEKFQEYFSNAPLMKVPGRLHPVEINYTREPVKNYVDTSIEVVLKIHREEPPGDILVFMTGEEEIRKVCESLEKAAAEFDPEMPELKAIPLYSALPPDQQEMIFAPPPPPKTPDGPPGRKVIVSTNIAETSLTIDGIVYVIDPGFSKQKFYNPRISGESLQVSPISRASAKQRAGRAGRTKPGKCYRLYNMDAFENHLLEQTYPEILRSNLESVVLQLKRIGIEDIVRFDYMDPPAGETLMRALQNLNYLGALDDDGNLTSIGSTMTEFPLDPRLSKMIITSKEFRCLPEVLIIAAMLSVSNPFVRPKEESSQADMKKSEFAHRDGDHLTLLNLFLSYRANGCNEKWCREHFINYRTMKQSESVREQLEQICTRIRYPMADQLSLTHPNYFRNIKKCLVSGYYMNVAFLARDAAKYRTVRENEDVDLHPSCVLDYRPQWVVYNEYVDTTKRFIRTCTAIDGEWWAAPAPPPARLLELAPHYYDLADFDPCEAKNELLRIQNRRG